MSDTMDLRPAPPPVLGSIPWGYGENRVTAMARDPGWVFVYWELTDDAIKAARARLEAPDAGCWLRVYDTTYRFFDGTNANWSMDVPVHRPANNHYVHVGRPGATVHVDIGVRGGEGRFAPIARSGPVELPRDSISADSRVEWMTVTTDGPSPAAYEHRFAPRPGAPAAATGRPGRGELERVSRALVGEDWSQTEWAETEMGGRIVRWMRWIGPFHHEVWRLAGALQVGVVFEGERRTIHMTDGVRTLFGPWRVTIQRVGPEGTLHVIDRWTVHYSWLTGGGVARVETLPIITRIVRRYRVAEVGGSEARLLTAAAASEVLQVGASEWRWLGASELRLQGASELLFAGASELRYLGASALSFVGASELSRLRASESLALGASAALLGGASQWPGPLSETRP